METEQEREQNFSSGISVKLFVGCMITPDLRLQLNQNTDWQRMIAFPDSNTDKVQELHYQDKDYFGKFLKEAQPTLAEIRSAEKVIRSAIENYCPSTDASSIKLQLFSQIFLA